MATARERERERARERESERESVREKYPIEHTVAVAVTAARVAARKLGPVKAALEERRVAAARRLARAALAAVAIPVHLFHIN